MGNHLPWPALLDRHPVWVVIAFSILGMVAAGVAGLLWVKDSSEQRPATIEPLPPPTVELCLGRDAEVAQVAADWAAGRSVAVIGGPGIGKSTVLGRALSEEAVVAAFGARRFVVSCDGAESVGAVIDKLADVLGVPLGEHLRNRVVSSLRSARCVLVLDNVETVADHDPDGAAKLVTTLRAEPSPVVLGLGYRGAAPPRSFGALSPVRLAPLTQDIARKLFLVEAGDQHRHDQHLDALLAELDGVPLAIVLLGALAATEPRLDDLVTAWHRKRTELLELGTRPDRTSSVPVSVELSWESLTGDAHAALSLAALLPDGWPEDRSSLYLPDSLTAGVIELRRRALVHDDRRRQRCLAPIRQHVLSRHAPDLPLLRQLLPNIETLTDRCGEIGEAQGAEALAEMAPEFINLTGVIRFGLPLDQEISDLVTGLLEFQRFTGLGDDQLALQALATTTSTEVQANLSVALGGIYLARSENSRADECFERALALFEQLDDPLGQGNCLRYLGDREFRRSDNARAREYYDRAMLSYERARDPVRIAHCLVSVAEIDNVEGEEEQARSLLERALSLYEQGEFPLGQANALSVLGDLALGAGDTSQARTLYERALPLYQQVGSTRGPAMCLLDLGDVAREEGKHQRARELLEQAIPLFRQLGDVPGEADCLRQLGMVAFDQDDTAEARTMFERALELYEQAEELGGQASTLSCLADVEMSEERTVRAQELYQRALTMYEQGGSVRGLAQCLYDLGLAMLLNGDPLAWDPLERALPLYRKVADLAGQARTHALLTNVTVEEEQRAHCAAMHQLAAELNQPGFLDELRESANC